MITIDMLDRVQRGDQAAFETILREWEPWMRRSARRIAGGPLWRVPVMTLDDVMQELRAELWLATLSCDLSRGPSDAQGFLRMRVPSRVIDRFRGITHFRTGVRMHCFTDYDPFCTFQEKIAEEIAPLQVHHEDFEDRIKTLRSDLREIFELRFVGSMSLEEIGERVGCSSSAVHRRIQKGLDLLRQEGSKTK